MSTIMANNELNLQAERAFSDFVNERKICNERYDFAFTVWKLARDSFAAPAQAEPSGALPELPAPRVADIYGEYGYSEEQVHEIIRADRASRGQQAKQAIEARGGALSDAAILNLSEDFKRNYHACGADVEEFDALGFAKALLRILGQQGGGDATQLAAALTRLLEWRNPEGTIERAYIPGWLAAECRAAIKAQAGDAPAGGA